MPESTETLPEEVPVDLPGGGGKMVFRRILDEGKTAEFPMGQRGEYHFEEPVHRVRLTRPYYLGEFPVTQTQFAAWTESDAYREWFADNRETIRESSSQDEAEPHANHFADRPENPAENVTWWEAEAFGEWLTASGQLPEGWTAELPSEARWEYACRAGTETDYWSGNGEAALAEVGWYGGNAGGETHPVGEKNRPNPFGLHDLHGNVWEWCRDYYDARHYRKQVEYAEGLPLTDAEAVEPEGANPDHVAWAAITGHVAAGERAIPDSEMAALRRLSNLVKDVVGTEGLQEALKATLKRGEWPEPLLGIARHWHGAFQSQVDTALGTGSPDRVLRGGAWSYTARDCRSAYRVGNRSGNRGRGNGFRLALVPGPVRNKQGPEAEGAKRGAGARASRDDAAGAEAAREAESGPRSGEIIFSKNDDTDMTTADPTTGQKALSSVNGDSWHDGSPFPWPTEPDDRVTRVALGSLEDGKEIALSEKILAGLGEIGTHFPGLTHLHLWGLENLESIGGLPEGLKCLDVRKCGALTGIDSLPGNLETLVLGDCPKLEQAPEIPEGGMPNLEDLDIRNGRALPAEADKDSPSWPCRILPAAPALRFVNLSGNPGIHTIINWPENLEELRLNDCENLRHLPGWWPVDLAHLELENAVRVERLQDFPESLRHANLAGMESLHDLPGPRPLPEGIRALFLHGAGVLMPPASEHGESTEDNVATRTRAYFEEVALVGRGEVRRCKVMLLGNGSAGKTCLSLALDPETDPKEAAVLGTTHGVRFHGWSFQETVKKLAREVNAHIWDFGGQEIYHNTHRLFMEKGAVFVVLWKPEQDGEEAAADPQGYRDEWRPLRYWVDFIRLACPHHPQIRIVCSHRTERSKDLEAEHERQLGSELAARHPLYFVDSMTRGGEFETFRDDLKKLVARTIERQGVAVPTHWEIAQDLAGEWLRDLQEKEDPPLDEIYTTVEAFGEKLGERIDTVLAAARKHEFTKLRAAWESGAFPLDPDRVKRTLAFLTYSGWLFWNPKLSEEQVIVGQQWALNGMYAALERRESEEVYQILKERRGRFTRSNLPEKHWQRRSEKERDILVAFMKLTGMCFPLVAAEESVWEEEVLVSITHLPSAAELDFEDAFANQKGIHSAAGAVDLKRDSLHRGHWNAALSALGRHYGVTAEYAKDGFFLPENKKGQRALVTCRIDGRKGLGGRIRIEARGPDADELSESLQTLVEKCLPGETGHSRKTTPLVQEHFHEDERHDRLKIFFSYTWNPNEEGDAPLDYEKPVDAVYEELAADPRLIPLRDKKIDFSPSNKWVSGFMSDIRTCDRILIFHSRKYWESKYCLWELYAMSRGFNESKGNVKENCILVEVGRSVLASADEKNELTKIWESRGEKASGFEVPLWMSRLCPPVSGRKEMAEIAKEVIRWLPALSETEVPQFLWKEGTESELIAWVKEKLGPTISE